MKIMRNETLIAIGIWLLKAIGWLYLIFAPLTALAAIFMLSTGSIVSSLVILIYAAFMLPLGPLLHAQARIIQKFDKET